MNQQKMTAGSKSIAYLRTETRQPEVTVVFIHGYPFAKEMWEDQLYALPGTIEGIAYDIRGYGKSDPGQQFFSIDLFAKDLVAFITTLRLKKVVLCGISMGGYIALRAIEIAPVLVDGLILCDTTSQPDTNETKLNRFNSIEAILNDGVEAYASGFLKNIFLPEMLEERPAAVNKISNMITAVPPDILCSTLLALASRTDTTPGLEAIRVPCLVIRGAGDKVITSEQALSLQRHLGGSELSIIPGSGHLPNVDNPDAFNEQMNKFLSTFMPA